MNASDPLVLNAGRRAEDLSIRHGLRAIAAAWARGWVLFVAISRPRAVNGPVAWK